MSKHRAGLHKKVSAIFDGVSLPKDDGAQQPSTAPASGHPDYIAPKPPAPEPPAAKPPAPSHMTPTKPKPKQPVVQPPPKAVPAKQPKADTAIKAAGQIPWQRTVEQMKNKLFAPKPGVSTTRQKKMVILAPVLFIVLVFMFIRAFSTPSGAKATPPALEPSGAVAVSNGETDWQVPELYPATLRDPMRFGSVTTQARTDELIVKGIVYSEDNPSAVIGDQIVHEGDKVLDVAIVKINEDSVELEANGKRWTQKVQR